MSTSSTRFLPQTFLIGLFALLPLALTIAVLAWAVDLVADYLGPESAIGRVLTSFGLSVGGTTGLAYGLGVVLVLTGIYFLGMALRYGLRARFKMGMSSFFKRLPVIGGIYDISNRMVGLLEPGDTPDLKSMTPVWCQFGGVGGATALAFLPHPEPVEIGGRSFHCVLIPSSPVPMGGGLLFVPSEWVTPAEVGVEGMVSIYMSMGTTAGDYLKSVGVAT